MDELKKLIAAAEEMFAKGSIAISADDGFYDEKSAIAYETISDLASTVCNAKQKMRLMETTKRTDLVFGKVYNRICSCAKCDEGRQECAYKINYVCGKHEVILPNTVHSRVDGLFWLRDKTRMTVCDFGYGETMIEAQLNYEAAIEKQPNAE